MIHLDDLRSIDEMRILAPDIVRRCAGLDREKIELMAAQDIAGGEGRAAFAVARQRIRNKIATTDCDPMRAWLACKVGRG